MRFLPTDKQQNKIVLRAARRLWRAASVALCCAACAGTALAQPPEKTGAELQPPNILPELVVEGTRPGDNAAGNSDAASQGTVSGKRLQYLPLLRPGELLETVPGMVVTQHSGDGKANQYFLRGYNLDHGTDFAAFVDGVPVNMPTNAHGQGYADLNFLIPELVRRINYGKGPYFAEDGDFSSAGSAKFQYRDRLDNNLANLTLGSYGYRRTLLAGSTSFAQQGGDASADGGGVTLLGAADILGENGPWAQPEGLHRFNGLMRLSNGMPVRGWSVDGVYYDADWRSTDQVPLQLIQSGQLGMFGSLDPSDGGDSGRAIVSGEWHSEDAQGYARASAFVQHYRLQLWSNFTFFELRPATGDQFEQDEHRNIVGGQVTKGWLHPLLGRDSTTEAGIQIRHDAIHVGLLDTQNRIPFATVSDDDVNLTEAAVYAQNTTLWAPWLRSVAGVREDSIAMNMDSLSNPQNSGNTSGRKLLPKLSLIFGPWDKTEYFFSAGKGFHSNDARGAIDKIDPTTGAPASPAPALVGSMGKEIGLRTEAIAGLQSSLAAWSLNSDSELVYNADSGIGSTSPNGASKRYGLEWNNQIIPNAWLLLDANLAWTHARYTTMNDNGQSGNLIPNAVSKVALLGAMAHQDLWSGGVEIRYIGDYPLVQNGSLIAPSSTVTNVRVQRDLSRDFSVQMDVLNLFNRKYFDIAYAQDYRIGPASPVVPSGITVHPGEPLQVRVTAVVKF
jgi:outer membrane receptor protein involved in Fe transport